MTSTEKSRHAFHRGKIVPLDPQDIWQIERGILQLRSYNAQGTVTVLGWLQQGSFWGTCMTQLASIEAIAFTDSYLKRYSILEVNHSARLQQELLQQTLQRLHQAESLLAIAGLKRIEDRLISLLFLLKQEMGQDQGKMTRLRYRFTHQTLADTISTTRVTITRLLNEFQQQDWLQIDGDRHILIANYFIPDNRL